MDEQPLNILLTCEYQIVGLGIETYITKNHESICVSRCSSLTALYSILSIHHRDILFIDLALLKPSGLSVIKEILKIAPSLKVIVLSHHEGEPFISKSMECGALGFVSLKCDPNELNEAIAAALTNTRYLSREVAYEFALSNLDKSEQISSCLTTREYQVFTRLAKGESVRDIATTLHLSPKTIHVYRAGVMKKLHIKNASELTLTALKHGVISIETLT